MASRLIEQAEGSGAGALIAACVADQGSASHPWFAAGGLAGRDAADAIHFLCVLHGRHPGVIELAAERVVEPAGRAWLAEASAAMTGERRLLARLAVAAGGMPSTPNSAASEATVAAQRAALATLARSERHGCALGSALAFALDWRPIRAMLDAAAKRLGVEVPPLAFGDPEELRLVADVAGESALAERALLFGASQLAQQHRGLWDLLEARASARA